MACAVCGDSHDTVRRQQHAIECHRKCQKGEFNLFSLEYMSFEVGLLDSKGLAL